MAEKIQAIRGMHDILPAQIGLWQRLEDRMRSILEAYGYQEIRTPLIEITELFKRSIGEVTDIVEKEMYSFEDRNGDNLTLRPEGTASCVRAAIEHGLLNQTLRLWYRGPMFRHERPQQGRYRQFHQIGVEVFGLEGPDIDQEIILITKRFWQAIGIENLELQLNTLGSSDERRQYRTRLVEYFQAHAHQLDADSKRRLKTNPLRILDSKHPDMQELIASVPTLFDQLGVESREHFDRLCAGLSATGIGFQINPRLVRGLDYYNRTVFEWVTDQLGAQGTVCAGGRYDGLVEQLGGHPTPAVGFALGSERLVALLKQAEPVTTRARVDAYLVAMGVTAKHQALQIAENLRDQLPHLRLMTHCGSGSFKSQFKKADRSGATIAIVLGEDELARGVAGVKPLRGEGKQEQVALDQLADYLKDSLRV